MPSRTRLPLPLPPARSLPPSPSRDAGSPAWVSAGARRRTWQERRQPCEEFPAPAWREAPAVPGKRPGSGFVL